MMIKMNFIITNISEIKNARQNHVVVVYFIKKLMNFMIRLSISIFMCQNFKFIIDYINVKINTFYLL
ncbi:uncharacterized protein PVVCY_0904720 [Plasmodium vinckei vinckei]|uniref:Uncharacterized protein n=1 Tax=Plasmodium vinckei vinckei TaxID=54757 RepID=A0A449BT91_PLAVN|nr:uncharacterized protein PVVCY_0904720 [Plasmodium vinckei vinckei]VEV56661.1 hypothetical protein PVVCY_0904720 [Plasmodium vinckei vinckei]